MFVAAVRFPLTPVKAGIAAENYHPEKKLFYERLGVGVKEWKTKTVCPQTGD